MSQSLLNLYYDLATFSTNAISFFYDPKKHQFLLCFRPNEREELIPYRISKKWDREILVELLLLSDCKIFHYVLITELVILVQKVCGRKLHQRSQICQNCFHVHSNIEVMERQKKLCSSYEAVHIKMPKKKACILKFKNVQTRFHAPIELYCDLESLLLPVHTAFNNPKITQKLKNMFHRAFV